MTFHAHLGAFGKLTLVAGLEPVGRLELGALLGDERFLMRIQNVVLEQPDGAQVALDGVADLGYQ